MSVMVMIRVPEGTTAQYDRANEIMGIPDDLPAGLISHTCAADETGIYIADIWETAEAFHAFAESRLVAALKEAGVPIAEPKIVPVHNQIAG